MGYVRVKGIIGSPTRNVIREVYFLAYTGAFYTTIPLNLAKELDIKPIAKTTLTLADKRNIEVDTSLAYIKILDREAVLQIAILEVPEPLHSSKFS